MRFFLFIHLHRTLVVVLCQFLPVSFCFAPFACADAKTSFNRKIVYWMHKKALTSLLRNCAHERTRPQKKNATTEKSNERLQYIASLFLCSTFFAFNYFDHAKKEKKFRSWKKKHWIGNDRIGKPSRKTSRLNALGWVSSLLWSFCIHCSKIYIIYILSCVFILLVCVWARTSVSCSFLATLFHLPFFWISFTPFLFWELMMTSQEEEKKSPWATKQATSSSQGSSSNHEVSSVRMREKNGHKQVENIITNSDERKECTWSEENCIHKN